LALAAALALGDTDRVLGDADRVLGVAADAPGDADCVIGAAGTDGIDGNSPAAGAVVDHTTVRRLRELSIDAGRALALNDCHTALAAVGDALITGPTGTNVMDVVVALRAQQE